MSRLRTVAAEAYGTNRFQAHIVLSRPLPGKLHTHVIGGAPLAGT
eukprot:SAG11_NODE_38298_length_253_cov_0.525974_1_plen_44_part_01